MKKEYLDFLYKERHVVLSEMNKLKKDQYVHELDQRLQVIDSCIAMYLTTHKTN